MVGINLNMTLRVILFSHISIDDLHEFFSLMTKNDTYKIRANIFEMKPLINGFLRL